MSVVSETKVAPAREYTETVAIVCELCGKRGRGEAYPGGGDFASDNFDIEEVNVCRKEGSSYPEGGNTTTTILDICPDCFTAKLVPWFEAQGGKVRKKEVDF